MHSDTTCWNRTYRLSNRFADGDKKVVRPESHIDTLRRLPELIESGIKIQVDAIRNVCDEVLLLQHAGNVQEYVAFLAIARRSRYGSPTVCFVPWRSRLHRL